MMWNDDGKRLLRTTADFNYAECLLYLGRNDGELLHTVDPVQGTVRKLIRIGREPVLLQLQADGEKLIVTFPLGTPDTGARNAVAAYIDEWLDLNRDLEPFYAMAETDPILQAVVPRYRGLRLVGVPDLFEALCWAVMGQQISLHVAYMLKGRFTEAFGEALSAEGRTYWLFPAAQTVAALQPEDLLSLKFTRNKAEYVLGVAHLAAEGRLSKADLQRYTDIADMEKQLTGIRGIGRWSANYAIMRCLRHPEAFPIADAGLHNALKLLLQLERKPSTGEIEEWSHGWGSWKAYATFYLWRLLMS